MNYSAEKQTKKKYSRKIFSTVSQVHDRYAETHQWKNRTNQRFSWTGRIILSTMVLVPVSVTCHMITYQSITWYLSTWKVLSYYSEYKNYNIQPPNPIWFVCRAQGRWVLIINLQSSTQLCWLSITLLGDKNYGIIELFYYATFLDACSWNVPQKTEYVSISTPITTFIFMIK